MKREFRCSVGPDNALKGIAFFMIMISTVIVFFGLMIWFEINEWSLIDILRGQTFWMVVILSGFVLYLILFISKKLSKNDDIKTSDNLIKEYVVKIHNNHIEIEGQQDTIPWDHVKYAKENIYRGMVQVNKSLDITYFNETGNYRIYLMEQPAWAFSRLHDKVDPATYKEVCDFLKTKTKVIGVAGIEPTDSQLAAK